MMLLAGIGGGELDKLIFLTQVVREYPDFDDGRFSIPRLSLGFVLSLSTHAFFPKDSIFLSLFVLTSFFGFVPLPAFLLAEIEWHRRIGCAISSV